LADERDGRVDWLPWLAQILTIAVPAAVALMPPGRTADTTRRVYHAPVTRTDHGHSTHHHDAANRRLVPEQRDPWA